jgi:hypothetical protein
MARTPKGHASADQVFGVFRGDSKVEEVTRVWPNTAVGRAALVAQAHRPADRILGLAWELWEFDKDDFRKNVYAVWSKTATNAIHSWTFGEMLDHIDSNPTWVPQPFDPKKWAAVQNWRPGMKFDPPTKIGPLIAYEEKPGRIELEDGHTRLMAAHLEGVFPPIIHLYIGKRPGTF